MRAPTFQPIPHEKDDRYVRELRSMAWYGIACRIGFCLPTQTSHRRGLSRNYFRFSRSGELPLLRDGGFSFRKVEADGYVYPIFQLGLDFFGRSKYDDPTGSTPAFVRSIACESISTTSSLMRSRMRWFAADSPATVPPTARAGQSQWTDDHRSLARLSGVTPVPRVEPVFLPDSSGGGRPRHRGNRYCTSG